MQAGQGWNVKKLWLWTVALLLSGPAAADDVCERFILLPAPRTADQLAKSFNNFTLVQLKNRRGVMLLRHDSQASTELRVMSLRDTFTQGLRVEEWHAYGKVFQFFDVGFKNFERESQYLNSIIADHLLRHSEANLRIEFGPARSETESVLSRYRWTLLEAVFGRYEEVKDYISGTALSILEWQSFNDTNIDVFGLAEYDQRIPRGHLSDQELRERLRMTVQISYYGDRNFLETNLREIQRATGIEVDDNQGRFPFQTRLRAGDAYLFNHGLFTRFKPETTCEFTRLAKFINRLPPPILARFLLEAFQTAERRGMKTILASADSKTKKLFEPYGFRQFTTLPTGTGEEEFLMFLEVDSDLYAQNKLALTDLALKSIVRLHYPQK